MLATTSKSRTVNGSCFYLFFFYWPQNEYLLGWMLKSLWVLAIVHPLVAITLSWPQVGCRVPVAGFSSRSSHKPWAFKRKPTLNLLQLRSTWGHWLPFNPSILGSECLAQLVSQPIRGISPSWKLIFPNSLIATPKPLTFHPSLSRPPHTVSL